jgi:hypothetical protein
VSPLGALKELPSRGPGVERSGTRGEDSPNPERAANPLISRKKGRARARCPGVPAKCRGPGTVLALSRLAMAPKKHPRIGPEVWMTWLPPMGIVSLLGAHLLAAVLGLYSAAPRVTVVQPTPGASLHGEWEIAVRADDGPMGSGVRSVEYQLDSTTGAWTPLALDEASKTYKGSARTTSVMGGEHALYIRATDYTGNLRTVYVTVKVVHPPAGPAEAPGRAPSTDEHLSWAELRAALLRM